MKLGKIIGNVVSTKKVDSFEGVKLLLVQPLDDKLNNAGDVLIALDTIQAGEGDIVYYETSKEAGRVLDTVLNPSDASVMGIVDNILIEKKK